MKRVSIHNHFNPPDASLLTHMCSRTFARPESLAPGTLSRIESYLQIAEMSHDFSQSTTILFSTVGVYSTANRSFQERQSSLLIFNPQLSSKLLEITVIELRRMCISDSRILSSFCTSTNHSNPLSLVLSTPSQVVEPCGIYTKLYGPRRSFRTNI